MTTNFWRHEEHDPVGIAQGAMATARAHGWKRLSPPMQARQMRTLVVMSLQAATLSGEDGQLLGVLSDQTYADDVRNAVGAAVARTLVLLAPQAFPPAGSVATFEGQPMMSAPRESGTGLGPVAIVAIVGIASVASVLIAHQVASMVASRNFNKQKTAQLMNAQARVLDVIAKHVERERIAGKLLPFTEEELAVINALQGVQEKIAVQKQQPLPKPFEGARRFVETTGQTIESVGRTASALLPLAVLGAGAFILSEITPTHHDEEEEEKRT